MLQACLDSVDVDVDAVFEQFIEYQEMRYEWIFDDLVESIDVPIRGRGDPLIIGLDCEWYFDDRIHSNKLLSVNSSIKCNFISA